MRAKDFREIAWSNVRANLRSAVLAGLIAMYLGSLVASTSVDFTFSWNGAQITIPNLLMLPLTFLKRTTVLSVVQIVLGGVVRQGYCLFLLKEHDGRNPDVKDLFSQFEHFSRGFLLLLLETLYVLLWGLLFIIPGIIAAYRYSMAPFLLQENPDMTPSEAIEASKKLMDGHKWRLFCLDFSFIGWNLLNIVILGLGSLVLNPYMNAAYTAFYRELCPVSAPKVPDTTELPAAEPAPENPMTGNW